jgi:integrase
MTALASLADQARAYATAAHAPNTRRAYRSDWRHFAAWCAAAGAEPLPAQPAAVALYLTQMAHTAAYATIQRRLAAISQAHRMSRLPVPAQDESVRLVMAGIRRRLGIAHAKAKRPVRVDELRLILGAVPDTLPGRRDRALLLVGFVGAFRRSELVGIDVAHIERAPAGLIVTLPRRKNDQDGRGTKVALPHSSAAGVCPVRALDAWLEASGITAGPVFRSCEHGRARDGRLSGTAVSSILKRYCVAVGLDPAAYSAHSLRSGLVTSAAAAGKPERAIQQQTGHKSLLVMRRYIRDGELFRNNCAAGLL